MWHSYFFGLQKKYNMRISKKEPLVIRLDGKDVTKSRTINLIDDYKDSFYNSLKMSAWYFSNKYNCYCIFGSDEISFVFPNPKNLIEEYTPDDKSDYSNEITSLFSQYFFDYFNNLYGGDKIFWHAKSFSMPKAKITSYIKFRSKIIENVLTTYFLIRNNAYETNIKLYEKRNRCLEIKGFENLKNKVKGELYFDGKKVDLEKFLQNNEIVEIQENNSINAQVNKIFEDIEIDIDV